MKAEYIDHMGDDLRVVNAARVSFARASDWVPTYVDDPDAPIQARLSSADVRLIQYLARGCTTGQWEDIIEQLRTQGEKDEIIKLVKEVRDMPMHWTPFSHCVVTMRETVPIFVARQRFKHVVGFTYNEVSRRYVDALPKFYHPDVWRARSDDAKQGSSEDGVLGQKYLSHHYHKLMEDATHLYEDLCEKGVCPEQARMVLPQSMYTSYYVTGSLAAWARAYKQRSDTHAQREIQNLAKQWDLIIRPLFPVSWVALAS